MNTSQYVSLKERIIALGYGSEITWAQNIEPVSDPDIFWQEFAWVVLNSGMKEQIARKIWMKVRPAVEGGASASSVFGHEGKAAAIDTVYAKRADLLKLYQSTPSSERMDFLRELPWIGEITCYHLAKNYGFDCAKPDRHLTRIAGEEGTHGMCARIAKEIGDRIATVDLVIWRAANLGLV